jgi:hypothetical protein
MNAFMEDIRENWDQRRVQHQKSREATRRRNRIPLRT